MSKKPLIVNEFEAELIVSCLDAMSAIVKTGFGASGVDVLRKKDLIGNKHSIAATLERIKPVRKKFKAIQLE